MSRNRYKPGQHIEFMTNGIEAWFEAHYLEPALIRGWHVVKDSFGVKHEVPSKWVRPTTERS